MKAMRTIKNLIPLTVLLVAASCSTQPDAETIINKAIEKHGGEAYENSRIAFTFRGTRYTAVHQGGEFEYRRTIDDSSGVIVDRLSNEGLTRTLNDTTVNLSAQNSSAYANSLNSVIYFALLPFQLNDAAVNKELLGESTISGEPYYEIKVTFDQQGGGTDYEDEFVYWIHRDDYTVDYLAYRFHVNGGGTRFREAYNVRMINGIRFADYNNYRAADESAPLNKFDTLFEEGKLEKVSEINLENIEVKRLDGTC